MISAQGQSDAFLTLAEKEYHSGVFRNLSDKLDPGDTWQNALALYRAIKRSSFLKAAIAGAQSYIRKRVEKATDFDPDAAQLFFWTGFTPDYIGLFPIV
jgi:hypothetical protein